MDQIEIIISTYLFPLPVSPSSHFLQGILYIIYGFTSSLIWSFGCS